MGFVGMQDSRVVSLAEDDALVERLGEPLQYDAIDGVVLHKLPESRRSSSVFHLIVMVERPDAVSRGFQDFATDNVEAKSQNKVKFLFFNDFNIMI